jgi:hypothetical protein
MNDRMLLIVPSRGRPENIRRLCVALEDTNAELDLAVGVDQDDPILEQYKAVQDEYDFQLWISQERKRFAATVNYIALHSHEDYKYLAWMGDDHLPRTKHWDKRYRDVLDYLKVGVVYGNDLVMGQAIATELAFTSNIVGALGYAIPPGFVHLFVDNYFMELGNSINALQYLPDVVVEHLHPTVGNAQEDQTYREANSPENWTNDERRFRDYIANELSIDAEKLAELL